MVKAGHAAKPHMKPTSAGYVNIGVNRREEICVTCSGESPSLQLISKPEKDETLIKNMINEII